MKKILKNKKRYGIQRFITISLLFMLSTFNDSAVANEHSYLNNLLEHANEIKLYNKKYWHILLHYKKNILGQIESLIDDPNFFLASDGKVNPKSELESTIRALFDGSIDQADPIICKYIARYNWLKEQLKIDPSKVPIYDCKQIKHIKVKSANLAFPTYFMNNPASMFGHTLIILETEYPNKLLNHAVNYAAITNETNGILFAYKGIFGLFDGYYSILPYYKKIQEYSDINQRDIWEYQLNLTETELNRMILHIRELEKISAKYYFFSENCSYNLLFLLEAARPELDLTDQFGPFVIPIDTVKAVKEAGLITKTVYRPSKATKIKHIYKQLNTSDKHLAYNILQGKQDVETLLKFDMNPAQKIRITDYIIAYIQYRFVKRKLTRCNYQKILLQALKVRSKLGQVPENFYPIKRPDSPDNVHSSRRLSAGLGSTENELFHEYSYRFSFSDLLDTDYDKELGIQIELGNTKFRYYSKRKEFQLKSFAVADIVSLVPYNQVLGSFSWKVNFGLSQKTLATEDETLVGKVGTGAGLALYQTFMGLSYAFLETELNVGGGINGDSYQMGGGFSLGLLKKIFSWWKIHGNAKMMAYGFRKNYQAYHYELSQNFRLSRNNQVNISVSGVDRFEQYEKEIMCCWYYFF